MSRGRESNGKMLIIAQHYLSPHFPPLLSMMAAILEAGDEAGLGFSVVVVVVVVVCTFLGDLVAGLGVV